MTIDGQNKQTVVLDLNLLIIFFKLKKKRLQKYCICDSTVIIGIYEDRDLRKG